MLLPLDNTVFVLLIGDKAVLEGIVIFFCRITKQKNVFLFHFRKILFKQLIITPDY